jgi:MFS superfamily sulfate permease-like transporter
VVLILELLLFICGIVLIAAGKIPISKTKAVEGVVARLLGLLAMLPLVLMIGIGFVYGVIMARRGADPKPVQDKMVVIAVFELGFTLIVVGLIVGIAVMAAKETGDGRRRRKRRRRRDEDEDDEEDQPRKRSRRDDEDDDRDDRRGRNR